MSKARNLIPGWPRGRSTSRPLATGSSWPWQYVYGLISSELLHVGNTETYQGLNRSPWPRTSKTLHLDHAARLEDRIGQQAEERRKAEMMGTHYGMQRIEARGPLYPQPLSEQMFSLYLHGLEINPDTLAYCDEVRRVAEWLSGGAIGGTKKP